MHQAAGSVVVRNNKRAALLAWWVVIQDFSCCTQNLHARYIMRILFSQGSGAVFYVGADTLFCINLPSAREGDELIY